MRLRSGGARRRALSSVALVTLAAAGTLAAGAASAVGASNDASGSVAPASSRRSASAPRRSRRAPSPIARVFGSDGPSRRSGGRSTSSRGRIRRRTWRPRAPVCGAIPRFAGSTGPRRASAIAPRLIPDDIIWLQQGTVAIPGQNPASWNWHWAKANFPSAWDVTTSGASTVVSVIDSEFDTEHEDLKTKMRPGTNFDSGTPAYRTGDVRLTRVEEGHGTHVAGLVAAATGNRLGTSGACFDCTVIPYKISTFSTPGVGDAKFVADLTEALLASADDPSGVVNMSLGTRRDHPPLRAAVDAVRARGKVVIAAAGNDQQQNPGVNQYPAAYPGVVAVANTRPDDSINPSSSNGGFVDIAAPGTGDRVPLGQPTHGGEHLAAVRARRTAPDTRTSPATSMSAPIVAGLAAMIRTVRPDLTADEVEGVMASTAFDLGAQGRDQVFGAGRIDARRALDAALAFQRPAPPAPPAPAAAPPAPAPPPAVKKTRSRIFMTAKLGKRRLKNNRLQRVRVKVPDQGHGPDQARHPEGAGSRPTSGRRPHEGGWPRRDRRPLEDLPPGSDQQQGPVRFRLPAEDPRAGDDPRRPWLDLDACALRGAAASPPGGRAEAQGGDVARERP